MLTGLVNIVTKLVEIITGVLLTAIVLIMFYTVLSSRIAGVTPPWANEVPLILIVWFGLLGAGIGVRDKAHLAVEFIVRGMGDGLKNFFFRMSYVLMLTFSLVLIVAGSRLVQFVIANMETYPATKLPVGLCYAAIPAGGVIIFLTSLKHLVDLFTGKYDFRTLDDEALAEEQEKIEADSR